MGDASNFTCPYENCGKNLSSERALRSHARLHRASEPVECEIDNCKETFASDSDRNIHVRTVHDEGSSVPKDDCGKDHNTLTCQIVSKEQEKGSADAPSEPEQNDEMEGLRDIIQNGEYLASQLSIAKVSLWLSICADTL